MTKKLKYDKRICVSSDGSVEGERPPISTLHRSARCDLDARQSGAFGQGRQCVGRTETADLADALTHPRAVRRHGNRSACTSFASITLSSISWSNGALEIGCQPSSCGLKARHAPRSRYRPRIPGLEARQRHVRHFRMRIQKEQRHLGGVEIRPCRDARKRRRPVGRRPRPFRHHVASLAPALGEAPAVVGVGRQSGSRQKRHRQKHAIGDMAKPDC